jgi:hypothetical protein
LKQKKNFRSETDDAPKEFGDSEEKQSPESPSARPAVPRMGMGMGMGGFDPKQALKGLKPTGRSPAQ